MSKQDDSKVPQEPRAGVQWEGCSKSADGKHELRDGECVYPGESFVCRHCGQMVWWNLDRNGGY